MYGFLEMTYYAEEKHFIDQAFLGYLPRLNWGQINRYLIYCGIYHILSVLAQTSIIYRPISFMEVKNPMHT